MRIRLFLSASLNGRRLRVGVSDSSTWRAAPSGYSPHALDRARQRNVPTAVIEAAVAYGERRHQPDGRAVYTLDERAVAAAAVHDRVALHAFEGTEVVLARDGVVISVWRPTRRRGGAR